jgi:hypothetical protein
LVLFFGTLKFGAAHAIDHASSRTRMSRAFTYARCRFTPVDKVLLLGAVILIDFMCVINEPLYACCVRAH